MTFPDSRLGLFIAIPALLLLAASEGAESWSARRDRIAQMTTAEKEELLAKKERFEALGEEEQERLRRLHGELLADPQADQLQQVLQLYNGWLKTLESKERTELLSLSGSARIERIAELRQQQQEQRFRRLAAAKLAPEDHLAIRNWLNGYVQRHKDELLEGIPREYRDRFLHGSPSDQSRKLLMVAIQRRYRGGELPKPTSEDVRLLMADLSPDAREMLESTQDPARREVLVEQWVRASVFSGTIQQVSNEELQRFYMDDLDVQQRGELEGLSAEEMQRRLRQLYFEYRFRKLGQSFGPRGRPGPPPPPGERDHRGPPPFRPGTGRPDHERPQHDRPGGAGPDFDRPDRSDHGPFSD